MEREEKKQKRRLLRNRRGTGLMPSENNLINILFVVIAVANVDLGI